jgi:hypothetical protein
VDAKAVPYFRIGKGPAGAPEPPAGTARSAPRPVPERHWRSYGEHPLLPTAQEALAEPFAAFPSWFLKIKCDHCGEVTLLNGQRSCGPKCHCATTHPTQRKRRPSPTTASRPLSPSAATGRSKHADFEDIAEEEGSRWADAAQAMRRDMTRRVRDE